MGISLIDNFKKMYFDLGEFSSYTYAQLCELLNPDVFYQKITNEQQLIEFAQALNFNFAIANGWDPVKVEYKPLSHETMGSNNNNLKKIFLNNNFKQLLPLMIASKNTYLPYIFFDTVLHETVHSGQYYAVRADSFKGLTFSNKIAAYEFKLSDLKLDAYRTGLITKDVEENYGLSQILLAEAREKAHELLTNSYLGYGNSSAEIGAREQTLTEMTTLIEQYVPQQYKSTFLEYLNISKLHSKKLVTMPEFAGYDFFEELTKTALFDACPDAIETKNELVALIDEKFKSLGLKTFGEYESYNDLELLSEVIDSYVEKVNNHEISEQQFLTICEQLENNHVEQQNHDLKVLRSQYLSLFPQTQQLVNEHIVVNQSLVGDYTSLLKAQDSLTATGAKIKK